MIARLRVMLFIATLFVLAIPASAQKKKDNTSMVNVFIGTQGEGLASPGPALPYGMVQITPITRLSAPAYQYTDTVIYGFTHNTVTTSDSTKNNSLLFMPTTGTPDLYGKSNWSAYAKKEEQASPGYYKTLLTRYGIEVSITATIRAALHKYDFPKTDKANIIIDLQYGTTAQNAWLEIVNKHEIRGCRMTNNRRLYFYARFSKPFKSSGITTGNAPEQEKPRMEGKAVKMFVQFDNPGDVMVKVGLSRVSEAGALKNLETEIPGYNFKDIQKLAKTAWIDELSKIQVEGGGPTRQTQNAAASMSGINPSRRGKTPAPDYGLLRRTAFYTALYHAKLSPSVGSDIDGRYGDDTGKTAVAKDFIFYDVSGLPGSSRHNYQLLTLLDHKRTLDIIKSFTALPATTALKNDFSTLLADAFAKGIIHGQVIQSDKYTAAKLKYVPMRWHETQLDSLFKNPPGVTQYSYLPFMYGLTKSPYKAQVVLNRLLNTFTNASNGLPSGDAAGEVSAWYVLNSMGIYNLLPGNGQYAIGLPQFDRATITLPLGKNFTVLNAGASITLGNIYLQGINLNKERYTRLYINYNDMLKGAELEVFTGTMPNQLFMEDAEKPLLE
ncbi:hypothetical protein DJ568_08685 [Mucilaginibacter hurinus]|uniref:Glycoside hydrolase family 92 protein n=1 Tax=Mucilaginibacter hurinus TaxID=2201324 RepID=A0A367GP38_9SPHI|nr:glycoside hydrolase domain-containing protein [Mucilaginibacter hurinus]RCH55252.1 hypothetical protein DJ568_08685 [Mucilaginibacter hurinus]